MSAEAVRPSLRGERALVTGASGFIGSRLCAALRREGVDVHGVSRANQAAAGVCWHAGNLGDTEATMALVRETRQDYIFHLAGHVSGARSLDAVLPTLAVNLVGTVNILLAAAETGCKRVVLAGSLEEPDAADAPVPVSPYAAAKFAASAYGRMFHRLYGVPVVALRLFMVYGPGQLDTTKLVPYVITALHRGDAPRLSSGTRPVDWVYVDDAVEALIAAAVNERAVGETIDIGSGVLTSIRGVVEEIVRQMSPDAAPRFGAVPDRPSERVRAADTRRAIELLGWIASTPLEQGLASTIDWFALAGSLM